MSVVTLEIELIYQLNRECHILTNPLLRLHTLI